MTAQTAMSELDGNVVQCWCCSSRGPADTMVRLGNHPEVALCLRCAHWVHRQARDREDAGRTSPTVRARNLLRAGRREVMRRGWHNHPVVGRALRRLGPRLP